MNFKVCCRFPLLFVILCLWHVVLFRWIVILYSICLWMSLISGSMTHLRIQVPILSKRQYVHLRRKAVDFETSRVYSAVYVFLGRRKESFYLQVTCYFLIVPRPSALMLLLHISSFTEVSIQTTTTLVSKSVINYKQHRSTYKAYPSFTSPLISLYISTYCTVMFLYNAHFKLRIN